MKVKGTRGIFFAGLISFMGIWSLPDMMGFTSETLYLTNSIYPVMAWLLLTYFIYKGLSYVEWKHWHENICSLFLALMFSVCMALGSDMDSLEFVNLFDGKRIISVICSGIALFVVIKEVWSYLDMKSESDTANATDDETNAAGYTKKQFLMVMLGLCLAWLPVLLATYPGFFVYDAQDELNEVLTRQFTTHHPLFHVLMLGGIIAAVHKVTDSWNLGIACYMLIQMGIVSYCFTYMLQFLKKHHVCKAFRVGTFVFLAFFPVIPMYVLCSSKDTLFTVAVLMQLLLLYDMFTDIETFFKDKKKIIGFCFVTFFVLSLRHNGYYAFLVSIAFILLRIVCKKKKYIIKSLCLLLIPVVCYIGFNNLSVAVFQADTSERQEMLTVPIMQITRVYMTEPDFFTEEEKEILYEYLPEDALEKYNPKLSDGVKIHFNSDKYIEDSETFWKLWLHAGKSNVGTYLNAWLYTQYGFWYPDTVIDAYRGIQRYEYVYEDSSYFAWETEPPGERDSKLPWLNELYRKMSLEIAQQKIPVISMLFSPGFMFWLFLFAEMYFIKKKEYDKTLTFIMPFLIWLTVLLGPTYLVRYVLIFWFACPVMLAIFLNRYTKFK